MIDLFLAFQLIGAAGSFYLVSGFYYFLAYCILSLMALQVMPDPNQENEPKSSIHSSSESDSPRHEEDPLVSTNQTPRSSKSELVKADVEPDGRHCLPITFSTARTIIDNNSCPVSLNQIQMSRTNTSASTSSHDEHLPNFHSDGQSQSTTKTNSLQELNARLDDANPSSNAEGTVHSIGIDIDEEFGSSQLEFSGDDEHIQRVCSDSDCHSPRVHLPVDDIDV